MANNTISLRNQQLFDPGALQQSIPYQINGLTYKSNDINVHPRDEAGNIVLQENLETNPLLIIEPVSENINNRSILRVIDTTFRYFKFPITTDIEVPQIAASDLELDLSAIEFDPIYSRYKPSTDWVWGPTGTVETGFAYAGLLFDEVVEGLPQTNTNGYTVSKEAKNSGADLRLRFKLTHTFNSDVDAVGGVYFSIIKTGPNSALNREFRTGFASTLNAETRNSKLYDVITPVINAARVLFNVGYGNVGTSDKEETWNGYSDAFETNDQSLTTSVISYPWQTGPIDARLAGLTSLTDTQISNINIGLSYAGDPGYVPKTDKDVAATRIAALQTAYNNYNNTYNNLSEGSWGAIANGDTQIVYGDVIITNSEFEIGDIFQLGGLNGQPGHSILNQQSYWVITDASKNVDLWNQEKVV